MTKYVTTILKVAVHREEENPVFGEGNTFVSIEDEAAGPFIIIEQDDYESNRTIRIDYEELLAINEAAKMLMHQLYVEKAAMENSSLIQTEVEQEYYEDYKI
jgi:hypothetical protein